MESEEIKEVFFQMEQWHQNRIDVITRIIDDKKQADIKLVTKNGGQLILTGSEAAAYRLGLETARGLFCHFPLKLEAKEI